LSKDEFCSLKIFDAAVYTAVQLDRALLQEANDEFHFATARTSEEAGKLIEAGFEPTSGFSPNLPFFLKTNSFV